MAEAGSEPERAYTDQQLHSDEVTKKDILKFLQENAGFKVLAFAWLRILCMLRCFATQSMHGCTHARELRNREITKPTSGHV